MGPLSLLLSLSLFSSLPPSLPPSLPQPLPFSEEHDTIVDCMMVVAPDLMVFVNTNTKDSILHIPMRDITGWIHDDKR